MQHYRTGWFKPLLQIKPALWATTFFIPLPGSRAKEKTRECPSLLFNFFSSCCWILHGFPGAFAWDHTWWASRHVTSHHVTSLGCRPVVCNDGLHFSRWGGSVTGHCRKMSTPRSDRPVTVSACHPSVTELRVAFPSLAATPGQQGGTWAAYYWCHLCFLDQINGEFDSLAQLNLILLTSAIFIVVDYYLWRAGIVLSILMNSDSCLLESFRNMTKWKVFFLLLVRIKRCCEVKMKGLLSPTISI